MVISLADLQELIETFLSVEELRSAEQEVFFAMKNHSARNMSIKK